MDREQPGISARVALSSRPFTHSGMERPWPGGSPVCGLPTVEEVRGIPALTPGGQRRSGYGLVATPGIPVARGPLGPRPELPPATPYFRSMYRCAPRSPSLPFTTRLLWCRVGGRGSRLSVVIEGAFQPPLPVRFDPARCVPGPGGGGWRRLSTVWWGMRGLVSGSPTPHRSDDSGVGRTDRVKQMLLFGGYALTFTAPYRRQLARRTDPVRQSFLAGSCPSGWRGLFRSSRQPARWCGARWVAVGLGMWTRAAFPCWRGPELLLCRAGLGGPGGLSPVGPNLLVSWSVGVL